MVDAWTDVWTDGQVPIDESRRRGGREEGKGDARGKKGGRDVVELFDKS